MPQQIIAALIADGWSYQVISARTGIDEFRLRSCNLKSREMDRLMQIAEVEAGIDLDGEGEE